MQPEPVLPLTWISLTDDERQEFTTIEAAGEWLEIWDTDDPAYAEEALILDRYNRRVRLKVEGMRPLLFELYDPNPLSEETIRQIVEQSRQHWQVGQGKSFWACLWQRLTLLLKRR